LLAGLDHRHLHGNRPTTGSGLLRDRGPSPVSYERELIKERARTARESVAEAGTSDASRAVTEIRSAPPA
jgi:hypothetical protein